MLSTITAIRAFFLFIYPATDKPQMSKVMLHVTIITKEKE